MKRLVALTSVVAAAISASILSSQAQNFEANMTIEQEPGGAGSGRTGSGTATLTLSGTSLSYTVNFSGISAPSNNGHIHGPTPTSRPPQPTFGVLHNFNTFFTFGPQSGSFSGTWTGLTQLQIDDLIAGHMYVNIHSTAFTGGEIRGAITQVPEPSTYALLGSAALAGLALRRRKA